MDRQHRREARQHFARRLVGERYGEHAGGGDVARADEPRDPRREDARLAAACAGEDQRMLLGQSDRSKLFGIEVFEMKRQSARIISRVDPGTACAAMPAAGLAASEVCMVHSSALSWFTDARVLACLSCGTT